MGRLAIVGGGASGLAAAVAAAQALRAAGLRVGAREGGSQGAPAGDAGARRQAFGGAGPQAATGEGVEVVVFEADERVGRSILATGNGRCNFSNARIDAALYRNAAFVGRALDELMAQHCVLRGKATRAVLDGNPVCEFFADLGLVWREEGGGRLYPLANKASSVLDVLRAAAADAGVREACGRAAVRIDAPERAGGRFPVRFADGAVEHVDAVIVAVGGRAAQAIALPGGLACGPARAVLGPLRTDARLTRQLNNIRVRCAVELVRPNGQRAAALEAGADLRAAAAKAARAHARDLGRECRQAPFADERGTLLAREEGELLFRDYGVSGIAVFNLSRFAEEGDVLHLDLLPFVRTCDAESFLFARRKRMAAGGRTLAGEAFARGLLLPQVADVVLHEAGLRAEKPFEKADVPAFARSLKALPLKVRGIGDERQCQVRRGGMDVAAFDPRTLEALGVPGLHVCGEALDVDAPCGGYNLHWAWSSGMLAGRAAARRLAEGACAHA